MTQFKDLFKQEDSRIYSLFAYTDGRGHFDPSRNAALDFWAHDQAFDFSAYPLRGAGLEADDIVLVWAYVGSDRYLLVDARSFGGVTLDRKAADSTDGMIRFDGQTIDLRDFIGENRNAVTLTAANGRFNAHTLYDYNALFHTACAVEPHEQPVDWNNVELRVGRYEDWLNLRKAGASDSGSDNSRKKSSTQTSYRRALREALGHGVDATKIEPSSLIEELMSRTVSEGNKSKPTIADIIPGYDTCLIPDDCQGMLECADITALRSLSHGWRNVRNFDNSGTAAAALKQYLEFLDYDPYTSGRNVIYFGAPGTGKSHRLNQSLQAYEGRYERITFHADYLHAQFVGSLRPTMEASGDEDKPDRLTYRFTSGPFTNILIRALNDKDHMYALVIEEINRADAAAVFGDLFQLLDRDDNGASEYAISTNADLSRYLRSHLNETGMAYLAELTGSSLDERSTQTPLNIVIPPNMSILATMNSADQGVFPLDTAFKRRWDFLYVGIDDGADAIDDVWDGYRRRLNDLLLDKAHVNEDKLIGPFFIRDSIPSGAKRLPERFSETFKYKVLMYLFEDAARYKRKEIFRDYASGRNTLGKLFEDWDREDFGIFTGMTPFRAPDSADIDND
ncbi:AAA family ATPase [Bifidobacterium sp. 64T4]|uniref:AAA family ATPase n=1 Tax=Bifidobacterium pongonis TaxID=2834432 RepID=UPI001C55F4B7|nr:AAA family ATPase [Bifidobacterium pongonis]MBW3094223.1 AAA family ATPase [Bifidobacterium pongonis]